MMFRQLGWISTKCIHQASFARGYATKKSDAKSKISWKHPLVYTMVLVFLFGSQNLNVMRIRRESEELKQQYQFKISALETCIDRIKRGESFNVAKELEFADKEFKKHVYLKNRDYAALEKLEETASGDLDVTEYLNREVTKKTPEQAAVETIIIEDSPGAFEQAANTRKLKTFL